MNREHLVADLAALRYSVYLVKVWVQTNRGGFNADKILPGLIDIRNEAADLLDKWGDRVEPPRQKPGGGV